MKIRVNFPCKNPNHIFQHFFGWGPIICPDQPAPLGFPSVRCTSPIAMCLPLSHTPPERMLLADESYGYAALPGTLLFHLALNTWEYNYLLGRGGQPHLRIEGHSTRCRLYCLFAVLVCACLLRESTRPHFNPQHLFL